MLSLAALMVIAAQSDAALAVDVNADGTFTRTQAGTVTLTAENAGELTLEDVTLLLEVDSDDVGVGVNAACDEADDGTTQTVTCFVGALQRRSSVSLDVSLVPNVDGAIAVHVRATTTTLGDDPADNEVDVTFDVAPFVPADDDDVDGDDDGGGCSASGSASLPIAAALALALRGQSRMRKSGRAMPARASASAG